jgi:hypothetical protein
VQRDEVLSVHARELVEAEGLLGDRTVGGLRAAQASWGGYTR